jgi:hypothetical protein
MNKCLPQDIFHANEIFLKRLYIKHTNCCNRTDSNGQIWQERSAKYTNLYNLVQNICYVLRILFIALQNYLSKFCL